jgi:hypothetical protein
MHTSSKSPENKMPKQSFDFDPTLKSHKNSGSYNTTPLERRRFAILSDYFIITKMKATLPGKIICTKRLTLYQDCASIIEILFYAPWFVWFVGDDPDRQARWEISN